MRLSIVANLIGSYHFHPHHTPGIAGAITNTVTTSFGTIAAASLIQTIAEWLNRKFFREPLWKRFLRCDPCFCILLPLCCLCGTCVKIILQMLTKYALILHVFTGKPFWGSAKKTYKILRRHYKGAFVTEATSAVFLWMGSYFFSMSIFLISWVWMDAHFNTKTFPGVNANFLQSVIWLVWALFNIWSVPECVL